MKKVAVVYWSGTGNTEVMANTVVEGIQTAGTEAELFTASAFDVSKMDEYDAVAFDCPSMGAEQLEDTEFEPMFQDCEAVRQEDCAIWFLWLGRRRMDTQLGEYLQK